MCRVCYGPSLSCAEFAMCRVVPKSAFSVFSMTIFGRRIWHTYSSCSANPRIDKQGWLLQQIFHVLAIYSGLHVVDVSQKMSF